MRSVSTQASSAVTSTSATPVSAESSTTLEPPAEAHENQSLPRRRTAARPAASMCRRPASSLSATSDPLTTGPRPR